MLIRIRQCSFLFAFGTAHMKLKSPLADSSAEYTPDSLIKGNRRATRGVSIPKWTPRAVVIRRKEV